MEIPRCGGWGYDKHSLEWKLQRLGGLKQNCPPCVVGGGGGGGEEYGYFLELHNSENSVSQ